MTNTQKGVLRLIKGALTGEKQELPEEFNISEAVSIGKSHQILPMLYYGFKNCGFSLPGDVNSFLENTMFNLVFIDQNQLFEVSEIEKAFEKNGIDYMLLKGSVLKNIYPKTELRPMGDADILVKKESLDTVRKVLGRMGYIEKTDRNGQYDIVFDKKGILHLEVHWNIVSPYNTDYFSYFGDGWKFAKLCGGTTHRYEMSIEDMLIYDFVHLTNHYRHGGIGIRQLTDIWLLLKKYPNIDRKYLNECLKALKLETFFYNIERMLLCWFEDAKTTEMTEFLTDKIFSSGSYGTARSHAVSSELQRIKWSKNNNCNRLLLKIFPPYDLLCGPYPILRKGRCLLPFVWVYRIVRALLFKKKTIKLQSERLKTISADDMNEFERELNFVGLDFNFGKENTEE